MRMHREGLETTQLGILHFRINGAWKLTTKRAGTLVNSDRLGSLSRSGDHSTGWAALQISSAVSPEKWVRGVMAQVS